MTVINLDKNCIGWKMQNPPVGLEAKRIWEILVKLNWWWKRPKGFVVWVWVHGLLFVGEIGDWTINTHTSFTFIRSFTNSITHSLAFFVQCLEGYLGPFVSSLPFSSRKIDYITIKYIFIIQKMKNSYRSTKTIKLFTKYSKN